MKEINIICNEQFNKDNREFLICTKKDRLNIEFTKIKTKDMTTPFQLGENVEIQKNLDNEFFDITSSDNPNQKHKINRGNFVISCLFTAIMNINTDNFNKFKAKHKNCDNLTNLNAFLNHKVFHTLCDALKQISCENHNLFGIFMVNDFCLKKLNHVLNTKITENDMKNKDIEDILKMQRKKKLDMLAKFNISFLDCCVSFDNDIFNIEDTKEFTITDEFERLVDFWGTIGGNDLIAKEFSEEIVSKLDLVSDPKIMKQKIKKQIFETLCEGQNLDEFIQSTENLSNQLKEENSIQNQEIASFMNSKF